jgi:hypothetical protein
MNRRKFIIASATAGAAAAAVPWGYKQYEDYKWKSQPLIHPAVLMRFCDEATVRKIGQDYRNSFPAENSKDQLTSLILKEIKVPASAKTENVVNEGTLKIQGEKDFKDGQLVVLKGWVLSRTEARQCALLTFT